MVVLVMAGGATQQEDDDATRASLTKTLISFSLTAHLSPSRRVSLLTAPRLAHSSNGDEPALGRVEDAAAYDGGQSSQSVRVRLAGRVQQDGPVRTSLQALARLHFLLSQQPGAPLSASAADLASQLGRPDGTGAGQLLTVLASELHSLHAAAFAITDVRQFACLDSSNGTGRQSLVSVLPPLFDAFATWSMAADSQRKASSRISARGAVHAAVESLFNRIIAPILDPNRSSNGSPSSTPPPPPPGGKPPPPAGPRPNDSNSSSSSSSGSKHAIPSLRLDTPAQALSRAGSSRRRSSSAAPRVESADTQPPPPPPTSGSESADFMSASMTPWLTVIRLTEDFVVGTLLRASVSLMSSPTMRDILAGAVSAFIDVADTCVMHHRNYSAGAVIGAALQSPFSPVSPKAGSPWKEVWKKVSSKRVERIELFAKLASGKKEWKRMREFDDSLGRVKVPECPFVPYLGFVLAEADRLCTTYPAWLEQGTRINGQRVTATAAYLAVLLDAQAGCFASFPERPLATLAWLEDEAAFASSPAVLNTTGSAGSAGGLAASSPSMRDRIGGRARRSSLSLVSLITPRASSSTSDDSGASSGGGGLLGANGGSHGSSHGGSVEPSPAPSPRPGGGGGSLVRRFSRRSVQLTPGQMEQVEKSSAAREPSGLTQSDSAISSSGPHSRRSSASSSPELSPRSGQHSPRGGPISPRALADKLRRSRLGTSSASPLDEGSGGSTVVGRPRSGSLAPLASGGHTFDDAVGAEAVDSFDEAASPRAREMARVAARRRVSELTRESSMKELEQAVSEARSALAEGANRDDRRVKHARDELLTLLRDDGFARRAVLERLVDDSTWKYTRRVLDGVQRDGGEGDEDCAPAADAGESPESVVGPTRRGYRRLAKMRLFPGAHAPFVPTFVRELELDYELVQDRVELALLVGQSKDFFQGNWVLSQEDEQRSMHQKRVNELKMKKMALVGQIGRAKQVANSATVLTSLQADLLSVDQEINDLTLALASGGRSKSKSSSSTGATASDVLVTRKQRLRSVGLRLAHRATGGAITEPPQPTPLSLSPADCRAVLGCPAPLDNVFLLAGTVVRLVEVADAAEVGVAARLRRFGSTGRVILAALLAERDVYRRADGANVEFIQC